MYVQALKRRTWTRSWNAFSNRGNKNCFALSCSPLSIQECILTLPFMVFSTFYRLSCRLTLILSCSSHCRHALPQSSNAQNRTYRDVEAPLRQALDLIPTPPITVQQKSSFLNHIANVFFFILQEFMNNQQDIPPSRNIPNFPEAFHQSLFDLQVLTWIFMEDSTDEHYALGARIMILMATASTDAENQLHRICPPFDRSSSSTLMHWLWQHHLDSLQEQAFELSDVQVFFDIP